MLRAIPLFVIGALLAPQMETDASWELLSDGTDIGGFEQRQLTPFGVLTANNDGNVLAAPTGLELRLNERVLYALPRAAAEPDGVQTLFVAFPASGRAQLTGSTAQGPETKTIVENVLAREDVLVEPRVTVRGLGSDGDAAGPVTFLPSLHDATGAQVWHYDVLFEIFRGNVSVLRAQTHHHEMPQELTFRPEAPGPHRAHLIFYNGVGVTNTTFTPTSVWIDFEAITATRPGQVPIVPPADNGTDIELVLLSDHGDEVPLGEYVAVNAIGYMDGRRIHHVDYNATWIDPGGNVLFTSRTFHQIDAQLDILFRPLSPGAHNLFVTIEAGGRILTKTLDLEVLPAPTTPVILSLDGPTTAIAADASTLTLRGKNMGDQTAHGTPVELSIHRVGDDVPFLRHEFRLQDGEAQPTVTFPGPGRFEVLVRSLDVIGSRDAVATLDVTGEWLAADPATAVFDDGPVPSQGPALRELDEGFLSAVGVLVAGCLAAGFVWLSRRRR